MERARKDAWLSALVSGSLTALGSACAASAPKGASAGGALPVDERRAVAVIAAALKEAGETPDPGRQLSLASGKGLHVDVGAAQRRFGIAYLTRSDLAELDVGSDLPPRVSGNDLWITQGAGADTDAVVLLLDSANYTAPGGAERALSLAEQRLARDVRDFIVIAHQRRLP